MCDSGLLTGMMSRIHETHLHIVTGMIFGHIELFLDVVYNIALKIPFV